MHATEWECFSDILDNKHFVIDDWGPVHGPVTSFEIKRDDDLNITLTTTSQGDSTSSISRPPLGTIKESTDSVEFSFRYGEGRAIANGVISRNLNTKFAVATGESQKTETASVQSVEWCSSTSAEVAYTIDWLENVPDSYLWPDVTESRNTSGSVTEFKSYDFSLVMDVSTDQGGGTSRSCVHLKIEDMDIFFGRYPAGSKPGVQMPGFILYKGSPDALFREKLHNALSFSIGRYLIYLGSSGFNDQWVLNSFQAVRPFTLGEAATRLPTLPPAPLDFYVQWGLNRDLLHRMVSAIWEQYEKYNLHSVFWGYWHAVAAPAHIAAVHYAAILESLQGAFFEIEGAPSKALIEKNAWGPLKKELFAALEKAKAEEDTKSVLKNKIGMLNTAPQSILMQRFLSALDVLIGPVEQNAWTNGRNRAAHGGVIERHEFISVIRENKALAVLVNRLILAVSGGADHYHNYYTLEHPISPLAQAIPVEQPET